MEAFSPFPLESWLAACWELLCFFCRSSARATESPHCFENPPIGSSSSPYPCHINKPQPLLPSSPLPWSRWMESTGHSPSQHAVSTSSVAGDGRSVDEPQTSLPPATADASPQIVVPPYWQRHQRGESLISNDSHRLSNPFIRLVDNTDEPSEQSKGLWAKSAQIDQHVVVRGTAPGIGDYVVWTCKVETLNGGTIILRKRYHSHLQLPVEILLSRSRYSEFDKLRRNLVKTFPRSEASIPPLPRKSVVRKLNFLTERNLFTHYVEVNSRKTSLKSGEKVYLTFLSP